jgi:hypothetical protein
MTGPRLFIAATAIASVGAAGVGGYLAVRTGSTSSAAATAPVAAVTPALEPNQPAPAVAPASAEPNVKPRPAAVSRATSSTPEQVIQAPPAVPPSASVEAAVAPQTPAEAPAPIEAARPAAPADVAQAQPIFDEIEIADDAVIGIRLENAVSTETSAVEERVVGRVTRAVTVDGKTVIPAGAELVGHVTSVERGGKVKERARIGVRFTSLVINKVRTPIQTEAIYRVGESPRGEAAAKIGGSAVVGSIIGGMIGGKKGAAIGGTAGAAGGTAVVMKGDPNPAVFGAGTSLTVRLTAPIKLRVER